MTEASTKTRPRFGGDNAKKDEGEKSEGGPPPESKQPAGKAGKKQRPGLTLHRAGDVDRGQIKLKALVYGQSGVGKTHFASGASDVAICLVERQGFATIRDNHPHAVVPAHPDRDGVPVLTSMDGVRQFCGMAVRGELAAAGITTLVFDSITEIQQLMIEEILESKKKNGKVFTMADWGTLGTKMRAFLRLLRDLDYHVIVLGLADWHHDEESGRRIMQPLIKGSVQKEIAGYFNVVGYAYKRQDDNGEDGVAHYILVDGDDRYTCKPFGGLRGVLAPDFDLWLKVAASEDGEPLATVEEAPLPSTSMVGDRSIGRTARPRFGGGDDEGDEGEDEE